MFRNLLLIGIGRYLLQQLVQQHLPSSIPLGTLSVNIIGCFLIGAVHAGILFIKLLS